MAAENEHDFFRSSHGEQSVYSPRVGGARRRIRGRDARRVLVRFWVLNRSQP